MYASSPASACPHCGRRSKKSRWPIELTAALGLAVLCIAALAWHAGWDDAAAGSSVTPVAPAETVIARPYRQLTQSLDALIGYNRTLHLFRIENRDTFSWSHCQLSLNSHGISGYDLELESIRPGLPEAALLRSAEFVDAEGKNFDPSTEGVATLDLDCETPSGHRYYGARFGRKDSRPP